MTTTSISRRVRIGALIFAWIAAGCGSTDRVMLTSSRRLNACDGSEAHPVGVRVYYLASTDRFTQADFASLWENDLETLGEDRIKVTDLTVVPQSQQEVPLERPDKATAIGIVANFCKPGAGCWRAVLPLEGRKGKLGVHLGEGCISIE
jgi:type VI secretion system VasD/TssJ family lipoprotein